ncbi:MAG: alpha/beta hydrolase [Planctomycetota bacterium]|jgi:alpha-beta hydrolase superfamily lysophospholipase
MLQILGKIRTNQEQATLKDRPDIEPLAAADPAVYSEAAKGYFVHYGLDCQQSDTQHLFGSFKSGGFKLAAHLYEPAEYTATVVLVHGYLNHTGQFRHLIRFLLEHGYAVAVFDLPGHGLSSGETAAIHSFDQYIDTTQDFMQIVKSRLEGPFHGVGFSTGGSILIEMLLENMAEDFDRIVLAAPLIHWSAYEQSKATYIIYRSFTDKIPRFLRSNSSDKDYLIFNKTQDYLHSKHLSLKWVKALFNWNEKIEPMGPCDQEVLVIQGDKDGTVDWKYNLGLVRDKFPNAQIQMIPGANHELFNEAPQYKQQALSLVAEYFS